MSQPQVSYRQQYVSGVVAIGSGQYPASSEVYVVNRGDAAGTAKVQVWYAPGPELVSETEDVAQPGSMFRALAFLQWHHDPLIADHYWIEVWATSPDLIPSCAFISAPTIEALVGAATQTQMLAYFAPGDFAQFTLPEHHLPPPGPPVPPPIAP
jgi:hypothetical protein